MYDEYDGVREEQLNTYKYPNNYTSARTTFKKRNLLEAGSVAFILGMLLMSTPLTMVPKTLSIVLVCGIAAIFFIRGIHDESVTQYIFGYLRWFLLKRKKYTFKKPGAEPKKGERYTQDLIDVESIHDGIIFTKDKRAVMILELMPINFFLRNNTQRNDAIDNYLSYLKVSPEYFQIKAISDRLDTSDLIDYVYQCTRGESDNKIIKARNDYISQITRLNIGSITRRRFLVIYEYPGGAYKVKTSKIVRYMAGVKATFSAYMEMNGNVVINHRSEEEFQASILYTMLNRRSIHPDIELSKNYLFTSEVTGSFDERYARIAHDYMQMHGLDYNKDEMTQEVAEKINEDLTSLFASRGIDARNQDYIMADGMYFTYLYIKQDGYPSEQWGAWLGRWAQNENVSDIDFYARKQPKQATIAKITQYNKLKAPSAINQTEEKAEDMYSELESNRYILRKMKNENEDLFDCCTLITVSALTKEDLMQKRDQLMELLESEDIFAMDCKNYQMDAFLMTLPLLSIKSSIFNRAKRNMLTSSIAGTFLFTAIENYDPYGMVLGTSRGNLAAINPLSEQYTNSNFVIIGTSGSGKTFTSQMLMRRHRLLGRRVLAILPVKGFEQQNSCEAIGGTFIRLAPSSKNCINIMEIRPYDTNIDSFVDRSSAEAVCFLTQQVSKLITFMQLLMGDEKMSIVEKNLLDTVTIEMYREFGITEDNESLWEDSDHLIVKKMPIIQDWVNAIEKEDNLERCKIVLTPFIRGRCSSFNNQTNVDLSNKYIVFDVSEAGSDYLAPFMFLALDCCYAMMKQSRLSHDIIFLDEVWKLFNEASGPLVMELFKTCRGYNASCYAATQDISDFFGDEGGYGKAVVSVSNFKLILKLLQDEADRVRNIFHLSNSDIKRITKYSKGQAMMIIGSEMSTIEMKPTEEEVMLYSTDGKTLRKIEEKKKKKPSQAESDYQRKKQIKEETLSKSMDVLDRYDESIPIEEQDLGLVTVFYDASQKDDVSDEE